MLKWLWASLVFLGNLMLWVSCRNSNSDSLHTVGTPVRSAIKQNWIELSRDDFLEKVLEAKKESVLSERSQASVRLAFWVDRFDRYFRSVDPEGMKFVPKPNVVVLHSNQVNAFVTSTEICYDVNVFAGETSPGSLVTEESSVYFSKKDQMLFPKPAANCLPGDFSDLRPIFAEYSSKQTKCRVEIDDARREIYFKGDCYGSGAPLSGLQSRGLKAKKLVLRKVPNWFVVLSGILTAMKDEASVVGVIAHELAHYYRSHGLSNPGEYDYFYTLPLNMNHKSKPVEEHKLRKLGETVLRASMIFDYTSRFPDQSQKTSAFHYLAIGDLAKQAVAKGLKNENCNEIMSFETDVEKVKKMKFFPFGKPLDSALYSDFLKIGRDCLKAIEIEKIEVDLKAAYMKPSFLPFLSTPGMSDRKKTSYQRGVAAISFLAGAAKSAPGALDEKVFTEMENHYRSLDKEIKDLLQTASDRRLGQYTTEQEADDISAELLVSLGLGADSAIRTYLSLLPEEGSFGGLDLSKERCMEIYSSNWIDPRGEFAPSLLPLGNYSENHHSTCYRAFNIHREISAHRYSQGPKKDLSPEPWNVMVSELGEELKLRVPFEMLHSKTFLLENCVFSQP